MDTRTAPSPAMTIGQAASAVVVSAKMIRHYEALGLLSVAPRTESGYRLYGASDLQALRFIRQCRQLGFSMKQIDELMGLWRDSHRASREVKALAQRHIADLDTRLREMTDMKDQLERLVSCCRGDDTPHCAILEELAGSPREAVRAGAHQSVEP